MSGRPKVGIITREESTNPSSSVLSVIIEASILLRAETQWSVDWKGGARSGCRLGWRRVVGRGVGEDVGLLIVRRERHRRVSCLAVPKGDILSQSLGACAEVLDEADVLESACEECEDGVIERLDEGDEGRRGVEREGLIRRGGGELSGCKIYKESEMQLLSVDRG
jgi:hypothetical protein